MGICGSKSAVAPEREVTLLLLGLDNSGKTTVLANINGESTEGATPSVGFSNTKLEFGNFRVNFFDVGGGIRLRSIWQNYYAEASGSIYVLDASAHSRLMEAKEVIKGITEHERMCGKPLLIFANKQDCEGALSDEQIGLLLGLEGLPEDPGNITRVIKCVALKSASGDKADWAIRRGVKWLLGQIDRDFGRISDRVNADVAVQKAMEAQKRKERSERVRKIKEERERQQELAGVDVEETDGEPSDNPFKPIKQAAAETAAREKAAKARDKEIEEKLRNLQDTESALSDTRLAGAAEGGLGEEETANTDSRDDDGGDLDRESQLTSGLSASSNSLTDVTPESHSSAESLHEKIQPPVPPLPVSPVQTDQIHPPAPPLVKSSKPAADATQVTEKRGTEKRTRRSTLLSRLKARSKTAPLLFTSDQATTQDTPKAFFTNQETAPSVMRDTWTEPAWDPMEDATGQTANQPTPKAPPITEGTTSETLLPQKSNMQGLPDLPRSRVILPPLRLTKEPIGVTNKVLYTEQDIAAIPPESIIRLSDPPSLASSVQPLSS